LQSGAVISWLQNTNAGAGSAYDDSQFNSNVVWYGSSACASDLRNCRDDAYWTNLTDASSSGASAWKFLWGEGEQIGDAKNVEFFAWAVHDGDVGTPVP
jgi:hypothetical protein